MIDVHVQYTRALYSLSNSLRLACKIREQTYIAVNKVTVFSSFLFADFHPLQSFKSDSTLQEKFHFCIPRKGFARPQSQFSHSCVRERFVQYIHRIGLHIFLQQNRQTDRGNL
jgi:hypothetical protein